MVNIMNDNPIKSTSYLDKILKKYKIDINKPENILLLKWDMIVGDYFSSLCKCNGIKDDILYLVSENQTYASAVRINKGEIIKIVNSFLNRTSIKKIYVKVKT